MDYELKYGIDGNGQFVSINNVVSKGLGCGCVCPNCKQQLVAKIKGDKRKPHFAHYNPQHGFDKQKCYEHTMHILAKNILEEGLSIMLPSLDCIPSKRIGFKEVEKEERNDSKDLQPDIVGITEEGKRRLEHSSSSGQYDKVVLRFINTFIDGVSFIKIIPTTKVGEADHDAAEDQKGIVLGRFAELLNTHFSEIGSYETVIRDI